MARVVATAPNLSILGFPEVSTLLEAGAHTTPKAQLKRLATLQLEERPPLVVYLKDPEPHIRVLCGTQFVTLSFAQPIPEDRNVLAFA